MRRGRSLLALLLAGAFIVAPSPRALAQSGKFMVDKALTIRVDHSARKIEVTLRLAFYRRGGCVNRATSCQGVDQATVGKIVGAITSYWKGQRYRCYEVAFVIQGKIVQQQSDVGPDYVDVGLDYSPVGIQSNVAGANTGNYLSNDPADRLDIYHDPGNPTTWGAYRPPGAYAHEFGHVLGLDDNYDPNAPKLPRSGAAEDLMFWNYGGVSQEMIDRFVERSGQVDPNQLSCDLKVDAKFGFGSTATGVKCDAPEGFWELDVIGVLPGGIAVAGTIGINLGKDLKGPYSISAKETGGGVTIDVEGAGDAVFREGARPVIVLSEPTGHQITHTPLGDFSAPLKSQFGEIELPVTYGAFCTP